MGKILEIKEKVPVVAILPDGNYSGIWGGSIIEINFQGKTYQLTTDEGVKGIGIKVVVAIKDGKGTFIELRN